jgi:hypothetical protein
MARTPERELWLCPDCTIATCNDDYTGMDDAQEAATKAGLDAVKGWLALNSSPEADGGAGEIEFSNRRCDVCDGLPGARTRFALFRDSETTR